MRLIWLFIIVLACIGMVFLFRDGLRAHAEKYHRSSVEVRSNKEAKGDRLELPSHPAQRQSPATVSIAPARQAAETLEIAKPMETDSWRRRGGVRTSPKVLSYGNRTRLRRAKIR